MIIIITIQRTLNAKKCPFFISNVFLSEGISFLHHKSQRSRSRFLKYKINPDRVVWQINKSFDCMEFFIVFFRTNTYIIEYILKKSKIPILFIMHWLQIFKTRKKRPEGLKKWVEIFRLYTKVYYHLNICRDLLGSGQSMWIPVSSHSHKNQYEP